MQLIEIVNKPGAGMTGASDTFTPDQLEQTAERLEAQGAEAAMRWAHDSFGDNIALACSFGGPTGMVLVDMTSRLGMRPEIFYLVTNVLFPETYELRDEVSRRYGVSPVAYTS